MPFLYYDLILHAAGLAAVAVCFATVLVGDGMLLAPVQRWVRETHKRLWLWFHLRTRWADRDVDHIYYKLEADLDLQWWWKPLWGCYLCVAGQWGFWAYFFLTWPHYHLLHHLYFTSLTLLFAALWRGVFAWATRQ